MSIKKKTSKQKPSNSKLLPLPPRDGKGFYNYDKNNDNRLDDINFKQLR